MRKRVALSCVSVLALGATVASIHAQQAVAPPKARYVMDVSTTTGFAAMGSGMGSAMSMMFGGGQNREARSIEMRLGSVLAPTGAPKADHFIQPPMKMGKSLPLLTPEPTTRTEPTERDRMPEQFRKPQGRILIFWGCGDHAPKGQPVIIDLSKIGPGMKPGDFPTTVFTSRVSSDRGPTFANSRTYGDYPNRQANKAPPKDSSLLGAHKIVSTYAPEINFTLAQDYMPGLFVKNTPAASGGIALSWNAVTGATGYYAWSFGGSMDQGGGGMRDMVIWSSSNAREMGGGLWDWLPPATVARLINEKVVLPPSQTSCTIPAEVKAASPGFMMGNMNAYGPEANFAYPPRPADPKVAWKPDWTARVRFKSTTGWISGMPGMGGGAAEQGEGSAPPSDQPRKKCGILQRAAGLC